MEKSILIRYSPRGDQQDVSIPLLYNKEDEDNIQVLTCRVNMPYPQIPSWLHPHKFQLRALYDGNTYMPLMNETSGNYTLDAALFMEKAQEEILTAEKRKGTHAV
jgi:hypothetical protein